MIANDVGVRGKRIYNFNAPATGSAVTMESLLSTAQKAEIASGAIRCLSMLIYVAGASDLVIYDDVDPTQTFPVASGGAFEMPHIDALSAVISSSDGTPTACKVYMVCA